MWVFNVFLYLVFLAWPSLYPEFVAAGYACYGNVAVNGQVSTDPPPPCPYDPSNTN